MLKHILSIFSLFVISCFCLESCDNMTITTGDGKNAVKGNGILVNTERQINPFNQITLEGVFNVVLSQGNKEMVKIETDENIEPLIVTSVENNVLTVKMKDSTSISKMKKINVFITFVNLSKLSTKGVGSLKCANELMLTNLELVCEGVGATELNLSATKLTINSEIVGLLALKGDVQEADIHHSGVGMIDAFDLKTEKLSLHTEGVGGAEVYATKELVINASGLGGIKYKGNPAVKNIKNEGIGKVESVD